ncbi:hypothetical protein [Streptomyces sp. NPDC051561]|uniref:hypothetical protein n=1 Tax=Streptomyces sp. NPDC051561 TaxID=3365658 RepID=UPI0037A04FCE
MPSTEDYLRTGLLTRSPWTAAKAARCSSRTAICPAFATHTVLLTALLGRPLTALVRRLRQPAHDTRAAPAPPGAATPIPYNLVGRTPSG